MSETHQTGQSVFRSILPETIDWKSFPAFPPSAQLAILVGEPSKPGPYVVRVKVPAGVKLMPHTHPEDRIYTVISGVFYIGLGSRFDGDQVNAYPPGSLIIRRVASSSFQEIRHTSLGRNPVSTSHRSRRSDHLASNIWIRATIRVSRLAERDCRRFQENARSGSAT